jgi:hypothetical protein
MSNFSADLFQGFCIEDLQGIADENSSFRGYVQGYLAELKLKQHLLSIPGVLSVEKIQDQADDKGDFRVTMSDRSFIVEAKSIASTGVKENLIDGGLEATVVVKSTDHVESEDGVRTSCVKAGTFDILAICTFQATGTWEFLFIHNKHLPRSIKYPNRLQSSIRLNTLTTPCMYSDITQVFPDLS